jgi:hypothetical protein
VRRAARGTRDDDGGECAVPDAAQRAALRRQARDVQVQAVALAVAGTAIATALRLVLSGTR